jgi:hypothetical protein
MLARLLNITDALSQLFQCAFLPRPDSTSADESTSGRCHWEAHHASRHWTWRAAERAIDTLFWFDRQDGKGHCELADLRDYERAREKVRRVERRNIKSREARP